MYKQENDLKGTCGGEAGEMGSDVKQQNREIQHKQVHKKICIYKK